MHCSPNRFSRLLTCLLAFGWLLFSATGQAQIRESSDRIVDMVTERTLERLPELSLAIPQSLASDKDVYLLVALGAATQDVRLLARESVTPATLAAALQSAMQNTRSRPAAYLWSQDEDYSAARFTLSRAHFGQKASFSVFPLGQLVNGLRRAGWRCHVLVRVPRYLDSESLSLPSHANASNRWYLADNAPENLVVTTRAELSPSEYALGWLLPLAAPIIGLLSIALAVVLTRAGEAALAIRQKRFFYIAWGPLFVAALSAVSIGFFYMSSLTAAKTADLWLGETMRVSTMILLLPNVMAISLFGLVAVLIQTKLFPGSASSEPKTIFEATSDAEARTVRKRVARYGLVPSLAGLALLVITSSVLPVKSGLYQILRIVSMILCFCGPMTVQWLFRRQLRELENEADDAELTRIAERVGQDMAFPVRIVRVRNSEVARKFVQIEVTRNGRVMVSRKALELFTLDELEFLLSEAVAGAHRNRFTFLKLFCFSLTFSLPVTILTFAGAFKLSFAQAAWRLPATFAAFVLMSVSALLYASWSNRRESLAAYRRALQNTSNLAAAETAIRKRLSSGDMTGAEETGLSKALTKQIALLHEAARSLELA